MSAPGLKWPCPTTIQVLINKLLELENSGSSTQDAIYELKLVIEIIKGKDRLNVQGYPQVVGLITATIEDAERLLDHA